MIFDDLERSDGRPASYAEGLSDFLNRVASPYFERVRHLIEQWFSEFCDSGKNDLRGRLRDDDRQFHGAFWELYVHESLRRLGDPVECHPALPDVNARPDFLMRSGLHTAYVEATLSPDPLEDWGTEQRRSQLLDVLDTITSPNFSLWIDFVAEGNQAAATRPLRRELEEWLGRLDPDEVGENQRRNGIEAIAPLRWEDSGWILEFRPIPLDPEARGRDDHRPVGAMGPAEAAMIDDRGAIRRSLKSKSGRYGDLDAPYVIAVRTSSPFADDTDVMDALFGSTQVTFWRDETGATATRESRARDGFWHGPAGPQNTRVSAVLVARSLMPWTVAKDTLTLWHNPWAVRPVEFGSPPWREAVPNQETGTIEFRGPEVEAHRFFDFEREWPGPDSPFPDEDD